MKYIPKEEDEQKAVVDYLELKKLTFTSINPNSYVKGWGMRMWRKAMGIRPGCPDLMIIVKGKKGVKRLLFIEMKRCKLRTIDKTQSEWINELNHIDNVHATVCFGFDEAKLTIDDFMKL